MTTGFNTYSSNIWHGKRSCCGAFFDPTEAVDEEVANERGLEPCDHCCDGEWPSNWGDTIDE